MRFYMLDNAFIDGELIYSLKTTDLIAHIRGTHIFDLNGECKYLVNGHCVYSYYDGSIEFQIEGDHIYKI